MTDSPHTPATSEALAQNVRALLLNLMEPALGRTLGSASMLKGVTPSASGGLDVAIELPTPAYPGTVDLAERVRQTVAQQVPAAGMVNVVFSSQVRGKNTGATIGLKVKNVIAVGSGKGGVGKSTVATSIAFGLQSMGCAVGLMDADVYGPSVPHLVGAAEAKPLARKVRTKSGQEVDRIQPIDVAGLKVMSMGFFIQPDQAVVWRGPLLHRAITQFLQETEWGELDYLIIDLPPGTGDVSLTLSQMIGLAGAVVVCTPQQVALLDARKAISMYRQVKIPVLGIVENMTGEVFGRGGALKAAQELELPFLGEVPVDPGIRIRGDAGRMDSLFSEDNPSREALLTICRNTALQVAKGVLERPAAPTLEIL